MDSVRSKMFLERWAPVSIILLSWIGVLFVGLLTREPMIGDEVTHYYLAVTQSHDLSTPTISAEIPVNHGGQEVRNYPHVFLWHYLAAVVFRITGGSFFAVQIMQSLFWLQALVYSWLLFKSDDRGSVGVLVYLVVLASLPACLIFSVAFYQDVPAIAQLIASFYYLRKRRLAFSVIFILFALSIKETIVVMVPAYFGVMLYAYPWKEYRWKTVTRMGIVAVVFFAYFVMAVGLFIHLGQKYYPYAKVLPYIQKMGVNVRQIEECLGHEKQPPGTTVPVYTRKKIHKQQVANNPGDVRNPVNLLIYGGGLFWLTAGLGVVMVLPRLSQRETILGWSWVWAGCGIWYISFTAWFMRTAPDVRFFLPGVPLLLISMAELDSWLPRKRIWLPILISLAVIQSVIVLGKTYQLRHVKPGVISAIEFLKQHPPTPNRVFMYPEGNYRLFPCPHEWYMGHDRLRDFWKAGRDQRLAILQEMEVGAIVVKKWLVAPIDKDMNNLGVYPDFFVKDIARDRRFIMIYENPDITIYSVPFPGQVGANNSAGAAQP
ncbi:MAG: hypothetical protein PHR77_03710 [Kiritimatiellae bacterium]|nr:hypothetical protein [Kiritimatiellia bacterium]MDD5522678.1 hypothetical protein [Kiritimatiellia bacterium]